MRVSYQNWMRTGRPVARSFFNNFIQILFMIFSFLFTHYTTNHIIHEHLSARIAVAISFYCVFMNLSWNRTLGIRALSVIICPASLVILIIIIHIKVIYSFIFFFDGLNFMCQMSPLHTRANFDKSHSYALATICLINTNDTKIYYVCKCILPTVRQAMPTGYVLSSTWSSTSTKCIQYMYLYRTIII